MTTWGSVTNHARLGIDFSTTSMDSQGVVHTKVTVYYETLDGWTINDPSNTLTVSGAYTWSGSVNVNTTSNRRIVVYEATDWWQCFYGKTRWLTVNASFTGLWNNMNPSVSAGFTVPARPYATPADPTGFTTTRQNDSQIRVAFTATSSESRPVSRTIISRQTDGGSWESMPPVEGAGNKSWVDTGVSAGHYYRYRIGTVGPSGLSSSWVYSPNIYMTPFAPLNVTATKTADNNVRLSWTNNAVGDYTTRIYDGSTLVATVGAGVSSYTVSAPDPLVEHTYRVAAASPDGLESRREASNTVRLAAAPYQPTSLTPNGVYSPVGQKIVLTWQHNSSDLSAQSKAELQYSTNVTSPTWQTLATVTGNTSTYGTSKLSAQTGAFVWRVRTWGQDTSKPSPWSSSARVDVTVKPSVSIVKPAPGASIDTNMVDVSMTTGTTDPEARFEAVISPLPGSGTGIVTGAFVDKSAAATFMGLENNTAYEIKVRAGDKVWGDYATRSFTVAYAEPPTLHVAATWDTAKAAITVTTGQIPDTAQIDHVDYQRSIDGGEWKTFATGMRVGVIVTDPIPPLDGRVAYRAVTYSLLGVPAYGTPSMPEGTRPHEGVWLNWGTNNTVVASLLYNISYELAPVKEYVNDYFFAGHTTPTVLMSALVRRSVSVSAYLGSPNMKIVGGADKQGLGTLDVVRALRELASTAGLVVVRANDHPTIRGYVSSLRLPRNEKNEYSVDLVVVEAD